MMQKQTNLMRWSHFCGLKSTSDLIEEHITYFSNEKYSKAYHQANGPSVKRAMVIEVSTSDDVDNLLRQIPTPNLSDRMIENRLGDFEKLADHLRRCTRSDIESLGQRICQLEAQDKLATLIETTSAWRALVDSADELLPENKLRTMCFQPALEIRFVTLLNLLRLMDATGTFAKISAEAASNLARATEIVRFSCCAVAVGGDWNNPGYTAWFNADASNLLLTALLAPHRSHKMGDYRKAVFRGLAHPRVIRHVIDDACVYIPCVDTSLLDALAAINPRFVDDFIKGCKELAPGLGSTFRRDAIKNWVQETTEHKQVAIQMAFGKHWPSVVANPISWTLNKKMAHRVADAGDLIPNGMNYQDRLPTTAVEYCLAEHYKQYDHLPAVAAHANAPIKVAEDLARLDVPVDVIESIMLSPSLKRVCRELIGTSHEEEVAYLKTCLEKTSKVESCVLTLSCLAALNQTASGKHDRYNYLAELKQINQANASASDACPPFCMDRNPQLFHDAKPYVDFDRMIEWYQDMTGPAATSSDMENAKQILDVPGLISTVLGDTDITQEHNGKLINRWLAKNGIAGVVGFERFHSYLINKMNRDQRTPSAWIASFNQAFQIPEPIMSLHTKTISADERRYELCVVKDGHQLRKIGKAQNHCIGSRSYVESGISGRSIYILVLPQRDEEKGNDTETATQHKRRMSEGFAFQFERDGTLVQANGRFNSHKPSSQLRAAVCESVDKQLKRRHLSAA